MFNLSSHPSNPHCSPCILYDKKYPDALASPFLTWGTLVTGHIPLTMQSTHSGRGQQYIYFGRCLDARGGIELFNITMILRKLLPAALFVLCMTTLSPMSCIPAQ